MELLHHHLSYSRYVPDRAQLLSHGSQMHFGSWESGVLEGAAILQTKTTAKESDLQAVTVHLKRQGTYAKG